MQFWKVENAGQVGEVITRLIRTHLDEGEQVLWLVSGGSAVSIAVETSRLLQQGQVPTGKLVVSLVDERYGEVGHADSNWRQLMDGGFELPGARLEPVLKGKGMEATAADFSAFLEEWLGRADYRIGLLGIGPDGHTTGILPRSSAVDAPGLVATYEGGGYRRITTTAGALEKLDEAVVYAVGKAKWPVLDKLESELPATEQPAQLLKRIPNLTIYNDYKGAGL